MLKKIIPTIGSILLLTSSLSALSPECENVKKFTSISEVTPDNAVCVASFVSEEINKTLPTQIDKFTTLNTVISSEKTLNYKYSIHNLPENTNFKNVEKIMKQMLVNSNCSTPSSRTFLDNGIKFQHAYYTSLQKFMFDVLVTKELCEKMEEEITTPIPTPTVTTANTDSNKVIDKQKVSK